MDCELLQPEFGRQTSNSAGGQCQIAVFSDSSCSHLIESASTAYDSEAVFERRVVLAAGVFDVWIPGHRQANCFRMRLPAYFIRSTDHSKALSSSITVLKGDRYDASFASRIYQATSRLEIAIFRSYGPGIEVNSAVTVMGCVFAVLMIVHAAGLVRKAGGAQSPRRSLVARADVGPDKIGAATTHDGHVRRGSISSAEERITCDALADFCLGLFLSLEFCLLTLYLVTHTFVTEAIVASTLAALLMPILLVPYLLGMEGGARSPVADVSESKEHPAKRWSTRLNAWKPAEKSRFCVKLLMLLVFFALCLVYHIQVACFYIHKYTFACRRRMKRCKCKCACVVNFLIAALAAVSRALVSTSVYTIIYRTSENKQVVCATLRNAYVSAAAFQCCCSSSSISPCSQRCPAICCWRFPATERSSCGASSAVWCYCLVDSYCCSVQQFHYMKTVKTVKTAKTARRSKRRKRLILNMPLVMLVFLMMPRTHTWPAKMYP